MICGVGRAEGAVRWGGSGMGDVGEGLRVCGAALGESGDGTVAPVWSPQGGLDGWLDRIGGTGGKLVG